MTEENEIIIGVGAICDDCGVRSSDSFDTYCPYALEIDHEEIGACLCTVCYDRRVDEI